LTLEVLSVPTSFVRLMSKQLDRPMDPTKVEWIDRFQVLGESRDEIEVERLRHTAVIGAAPTFGASG
jgi:hypothetical protein